MLNKINIVLEFSYESFKEIGYSGDRLSEYDMKSIAADLGNLLKKDLDRHLKDKAESLDLPRL